MDRLCCSNCKKGPEQYLLGPDIFIVYTLVPAFIAKIKEPKVGVVILFAHFFVFVCAQR